MSQPGCQAGLPILQPPRCQPRSPAPPGRIGDVAPITGAPRPLPFLWSCQCSSAPGEPGWPSRCEDQPGTGASPLVPQAVPYQDPPESLGGGQNLGQPCLP